LGADLGWEEPLNMVVAMLEAWRMVRMAAVTLTAGVTMRVSDRSVSLRSSVCSCCCCWGHRAGSVSLRFARALVQELQAALPTSRARAKHHGGLMTAVALALWWRGARR
jgi:hypothetical protein